MYVRLTTIQGDPAKLDAAVEYAENTARSAVEGAPGNKGFAVLTDTASGTLLASSHWDSAEDRAASERSLADRRDQAGAIAGGEVTIENYELALVERFAPPEPGAVVRFVRTEIEPDRVDDAIAFYRNEVLPRVQAIPGITSVALSVDRESGRAVGASVWNDEPALSAAQATLDELRTLLADKLEIRFTGTERYTLVNSTLQID